MTSEKFKDVKYENRHLDQNNLKKFDKTIKGYVAQCSFSSLLSRLLGLQEYITTGTYPRL